MARWRAAAGRIEPPEWYRNFHPEAWDEPDSQEQQMIDGCPSMRPWPDDVHRWHAERRWGQAQHKYRQARVPDDGERASRADELIAKGYSPRTARLAQEIAR